VCVVCVVYVCVLCVSVCCVWCVCLCHVEGWARGGWVGGGWITSFNIYISHVKKIQNEERGTSPRFFFENFQL
jgi:hypothetical protein